MSESPPSDQSDSTRTLVRRGRSGDRRALDLVFARVVQRVWRWAHGRLPRRARSTVDTHDIVQDAAAGVWRRLDQVQLDKPGDLEAYVRQAVKHRILDTARQYQRRPPEVGIDSAIPDPWPSPLVDLERRDARSQYLEMLSQLSVEDREIVVARFEFGLNYEQIARVLLRPSPAAARMAVNRAVARLRASQPGDNG